MNSSIPRILSAGIVVAICVIGCGKDKPAAAPPQPAAVTVAHPLAHEIIDYDDFNGRLAAVDQVEVRARVSGFIESVHFKEGSLVKKGDLLYLIDPAPFQATYDRTVAEQARAQAQLEYNTSEFNRVSELRSQDAISVKELEDAKLAMRQSSAALDAAKAAAQSAKLDLDYTKVIAPIDGRIGARLVTPGNLITGGGATSATRLTTIVSVDPIYCYIDADERTVLKYQRLARERKRLSARDQPIPVWLGLSDEQGFSREGKADFVNNTFDPATGTITARATFDNHDLSLTPGLFARIRVPGSGKYQALLIPDIAIQTDQNQKFVYVVGTDNKAQYRHVDPGSVHEGLRVITSGLTEGDSVVINGFARLRPGVPVTATLSTITTRPSPDVGPTQQSTMPATMPMSASTAPTSRPH